MFFRPRCSADQTQQNNDTPTLPHILLENFLIAKQSTEWATGSAWNLAENVHSDDLPKHVTIDHRLHRGIHERD
jgi:hypothetical protein